MAIDISSTTRRIVYTGSAGTGPYAFNFEVLAETDVAVYFNDTELTLTTDYTVSDVTIDGTGEITIVVGTNVPTTPDADDRITIVGDRTIERTTDFTTGGPLFATSLNDEFDSLTIFAQQVLESNDRAIKAPVTDPDTIDMTIPKDDDRKGKYLSFNATTGNPEVVNTVTDVTTVAGIASDVTTVSGISSNVTTVANNDANVTTVATNISSVNTVATNIADVITVANDLAEAISEVETVANDLNEATSEIDTVANNIANVNNVGNNITNVNTVASISADVTTVAADGADIGVVAGISSDVTTVSGISADVTTVAADGTDIGTVAGISSNVTTVAGISANVTTVAGISSDVTAVAADATDIGTVATNITNVNNVGDNIANVNTVAGNDANITTVAGISSDVTTVGGISSDVSAVSTNNANVTTVASNISNVNTVAGVSSDVTTVATNIADVTNFADVYYGAASSAPSTRQDSSALQAGDLYFNTTVDQLYVWDGSSWDEAAFNTTGAVLSFNTRTGAVTLSSTDVTDALTYTPFDNASAGTMATQDANSVAITGGSVTGMSTPTSDSDVATKGYVDTAIEGLAYKPAINLLADSNISLTGTTGTLVIDSHAALVTADAGYRLLLTGQSTDSENGIYVYGDDGANYTLTRPDDADVYTELHGARVFILEGTVYGASGWIQDNYDTADFTGQNWVQVSGATLYSADAVTLELTGTQFAVKDNGIGATQINVSGNGTAGQFLASDGDGTMSWADVISFDSGTKMLFAQTSAPTGWTKDTTHDNKALRIVSGTAGSGGTEAFTTAFASQSVSISGTTDGTAAGGTVGNHTLATNRIPAHAHGPADIVRGPGTGRNSQPNIGGAVGNLTKSNTANAGGGAAHNHPFSGSSHTHSFSGSGSVNLAVQYVDVIIATKD